MSGSQQPPRLGAAPSGQRHVGRGTFARLLPRLVPPRAVPDGDVHARSARVRAGHALSVMGIVARRTGVPAALLALVTLTLCALAAGLPAGEGLVAAVPLIEPVGEWGSSALRTAVTAVGVLVALAFWLSPSPRRPGSSSRADTVSCSPS